MIWLKKYELTERTILDCSAATTASERNDENNERQHETQWRQFVCDRGRRHWSTVPVRNDRADWPSANITDVPIGGNNGPRDWRPSAHCRQLCVAAFFSSARPPWRLHTHTHGTTNKLTTMSNLKCKLLYKNFVLHVWKTLRTAYIWIVLKCVCNCIEIIFELMFKFNFWIQYIWLTIAFPRPPIYKKLSCLIER